MSNETYVNNYIEILTATVNDAIMKNISMQANAKVTDNVIKEQASLIEQLKTANADLASNFEKEKETNSQSENTRIQNLEQDNRNYINRITDLQNDIEQTKHIKNEYDGIKSQVQHMDTFRNELEKTRHELESTRNNYEAQIKLLNVTIENLKTPAKKKADVIKTTASVVTNSKQEKVEDGGVF